MRSLFATVQCPCRRLLPEALIVTVALSLALGSIYLVWVGFNESDDVFYAEAAMGWVQHAPFLGRTHWALRHCIVLPMALLFWTFGESETTLVLPSLIYEISLLALFAYMAWRLHGWLASAIVIIIAGTLPLIATGASLVSTDVPRRSSLSLRSGHFIGASGFPVRRCCCGAASWPASR